LRFASALRVTAAFLADALRLAALRFFAALFAWRDNAAFEATFFGSFFSAAMPVRALYHAERFHSSGLHRDE